MLVQCITRQASNVIGTSGSDACNLCDHHVSFVVDKRQDVNEPVARMEDLGEACIKLIRSEGFTLEWEVQEGRRSLDRTQDGGGQPLRPNTPRSDTRVAHIRSTEGLDTVVELSEHAGFFFRS